MESYDIRFKRITYIKKILKYREDNRPIIYIGETTIDDSQAQPKNNNLKRSKKTNYKGKRLIILHAGSEKGFIKNGLLMIQSGI